MAEKLINNEKLTIEALFSDSGHFDEDFVVRSLMPHIMIKKPDFAIFFKETKLSADKKILAYGLAKKLLKQKELVASEEITALEIYEKTGIKKGTVDPMFKLLRQKGLLAGKREYIIPAYKIKEAIEFINPTN